ncbi:MAG: hypothetical protein IPL93_05380 [Actinomycetales bacterium]|nr:hypothetical protein [Actinomycetales bacterium]
MQSSPLDESTGRFIVAPVKAAAQTGTRQTYAVKVGTRTIRATDNHPFLVLDDQRKPGRQRARYRRVWKTVAQLRPGDLVAVPRGLPEFGRSRSFDSTFGPATSSADLMWLLGFFLGDGNTQSSGRTHRVQFAVVTEDQEVRDEITRIVAEQFGLRTISADDVRLVVNSKGLVNWLRSHGFAGTSLTKSVPTWIHALPGERAARLPRWVGRRRWLRLVPPGLDRSCSPAARTTCWRTLLPWRSPAGCAPAVLPLLQSSPDRRRTHGRRLPPAHHRCLRAVGLP